MNKVVIMIDDLFIKLHPPFRRHNFDTIYYVNKSKYYLIDNIHKASVFNLGEFKNQIELGKISGLNSKNVSDIENKFVELDHDHIVMFGIIK